MRLIKVIIFCVLFLVFLIGISLAKTESPGIKIIEPINGSTVVPGEEITVTVEPVGGFELKEVLVVAPFGGDILTSSPFTIRLTIPNEAVGIISISASGKSVSGTFAGDEINLNVQQTAILQSLEVSPDELWFEVDWNGNIGIGDDSIQSVYGVYSDGIKRDFTKGKGTSYSSNDSSLVSIDSNGKVKAYKVGEATIMVSNSGVSKVIPVVFKKPTGIKPLETIPPTSQMDIQPLANSAGWHNQDITIAITAKDNEGGSGIAEINYQWYNLSAELEYVLGDSAVLYLSQEGRNGLMYFAVDKERNEEEERRLIEFKLDKTTPIITAQAQPLPDSSGWNKAPVTVSFTATDKLSGIASVTQPITVTTDGANQKIEGEAVDLAGNKANTSVTFNIDKTPPKISLELIPTRLNLSLQEKLKSPSGHLYKLTYSAQDELSGLKEIKAGLIMPDIAGFHARFIPGAHQRILINTRQKTLLITGPNPKETLKQIQQGLLLIPNNQPLHLLDAPNSTNWTIVQMHKFWQITAPVITFKAQAADNAGNVSTKRLVPRKRSF